MKLTKEQEILQQVILESWKNREFKEKLITDPQDAIKSLTGRQLKLGGKNKLVVTDQSEQDTFYFNLPPKSNLENVELTEEELELVSGGDIGDTIRKTKNAAKIAKAILDYLL